jgi:hypothetical protein
MKRRYFALLAAACVVVTGFGCSAKREPLVLVEPSYSHLRVEAQPAAAALPQMASSNQRSANRASQ